MDRIAEIVVTFVVNAAWQTTVIALAGIGITRFLRRAPARLRFQLAALTLVAAVAAPLTTLISRRDVRVPHGAPRSTASGNSAIVSSGVITLPQQVVNQGAADTIAIIYLAGMALAAARLLIAAGRTRTLLARSDPFAEGTRVSDEVASPITIGATILLPRALAQSELLPAVLAHESAHVRRGDFTVNALLQLVALPLWFHPAALLMRREIAELRELACDEEAARQSSPRAYAAALVRIAAITMRGDFALGVASTSIERRVALLRCPPSPSRAAEVFAIVCMFVVPLGLIAACSRTAIVPAIARPTLNGQWRLLQAQSDFGMMTPHAYDEYAQAIAQDARGVSVKQHRVANGRSEDQAWRVVTDGKWRAVDGIPAAKGRATWQNGRLTLCMKGPGAHSESAEAWISGGRLICDGDTERGHFHAVFQRED